MALLHYLITSRLRYVCSFFFFFNDPATPEIYTLSLHDALPISFLCQGTTNTPVPLMAGTKLQAPLGTTAAPAGQSACNILPPQLMDPNMQAVAQLLYGSLTPNLTGVAGKNFHQTLTNNQDPDSYNIR